ncbi:MAG TPA: DivIVA domain-containing protein [Acidimicrobiales bacterium]|jgi:DivIVA domain-containing protein|nr:DivIVA domain-containing protein [Acidimicrobiales bacterium]
MQLSPEGIASKQFQIALRGYDKDEVDSFLRDLADAVRERQGASEEVVTFAHLGTHIAGIAEAAAEAAARVRGDAEAWASTIIANAQQEAASRREEFERTLREERQAWDQERQMRAAELEKKALAVRAAIRAQEEAQQAAQNAQVAAQQAAEEAQEAAERSAAEMRASAAAILEEAKRIKARAEKDAEALMATTLRQVDEIRTSMRQQLMQSLDGLRMPGGADQPSLSPLAGDGPTPTGR